jgi:hypothetical protein
MASGDVLKILGDKVQREMEAKEREMEARAETKALQAGMRLARCLKFLQYPTYEEIEREVDKDLSEIDWGYVSVVAKKATVWMKEEYQQEKEKAEPKLSKNVEGVNQAIEQLTQSMKVLQITSASTAAQDEAMAEVRSHILFSFFPFLSFSFLLPELTTFNNFFIFFF